MRLPQFVAESSVPSSSGQSPIPAKAFGAEVFEGLGEVGVAAFKVVEQAEARKADLQRGTMLQQVETDAITAFTDFEASQAAAPNSVTHVEERDAWTRKYVDRALGKIEDIQVRTAAASRLGQLRDGAIVRARDEARRFANSEALVSTQGRIQAEKDKAHASGMDPEVVEESRININTLYDSLVNGGVLTPEAAYVARRKALEEFWNDGVISLIRNDPARGWEYAKSLRDNEAAKAELGSAGITTLVDKALDQMIRDETLENTRRERVSNDTSYGLYRALNAARKPGDFDELERMTDELWKARRLTGGDAKTFQDAIQKLREGGGKADSSVVSAIEFELHRTRGEGVSLQAIYSRVGDGLDQKEATRLAALRESLANPSGTMGWARTYIQRIVQPGEMEEFTMAQKMTMNIALQELEEATNMGNASPERIRQAAYDIANRLVRNRTMMQGSTPFVDIRDLDKAYRRGQVGKEDVRQAAATLPLPPEYDTWEKTYMAWLEYIDSDGKKGLSPEVANAMKDRFFPKPPASGKGKGSKAKDDKK
jgi:hypothetical protein